jgi:hypothetical protein
MDRRAGGNRAFIPLAVHASTAWKQSISNGILSAVNAWMPEELKFYNLIVIQSLPPGKAGQLP